MDTAMSFLQHISYTHTGAIEFESNLGQQSEKKWHTSVCKKEHGKIGVYTRLNSRQSRWCCRCSLPHRPRRGSRRRHPRPER